MSNLDNILKNMSEEDLIEVLAQLDPVSWTEHVRRLKGKPFSFKGRNYLKDIYRDKSKTIVLLKGRQIEGTELSLNLALNFLSANPYTNLAHVFPRAMQGENFSKQRLGTAIGESANLSKWYDGFGSNLMLRRFEKKDQGGQWNYYAIAGSMAGGGGECGDSLRGMSLDMLILDEWQDCNPDIAVVIGEGMSHSQYGKFIYLGTPKTTHDPLATTWYASDQKEWMFICPKCGHAHIPRFELIVNQGSEEKEQWEYTCPDCGGYPLDRENGYWKATAESPTGMSGYHVTQLIASWLTANDIMAKKRNPLYTTKRFMNEVLGLPFAGDDVPITESMLEQCAKDYALGDVFLEDGGYYVGVDWGSKSWMTIWEQKTGRLVDLAIAEDVDHRKHGQYFAQYLRKYSKKVRKVVCDNGPDVALYQNFADWLVEYKIVGRKNTFSCIYTNPPASSDVRFDEDKNKVTVGRTEIIDYLIDDIHNLNIALPQKSWDNPKLVLFRKHLCAMYCETVVNNSGNTFIQYINNGDDHFLHSTVYGLVAGYGKMGTPISKLAGAFITKHDEESKYKSPLATISKKGNNGFLKPRNKPNNTSKRYGRR